ncbi:MAG TPA: hypothetical protein PKC44_06875 [Agitococcus sp.]|nr:hypothetical protein [Agitococcus sp.]
MNEHRRKQWADLTTKSLVIWLGIFILLTVLGVEQDWAAYIAGFIALFLFSSMSYLNKHNFLTDEEVLLEIEKTDMEGKIKGNKQII